MRARYSSSGEPLAAALDTLGDGILLIVRSDNDAMPNKAGQHSDTALRPGESQNTWPPLDLGGALLLTNQIKPLLTWLRATR